MARIPESFIQDLITRTDIVDVIDEQVPLKKTGRNWQACCPFHTEKTPSFNVSPDKQIYKCFGCGVSGNVISFLMEYNKMDFVESIYELAARAGMTVPQEAGGSFKGGDFTKLYAALQTAADYYAKQLKDHPLADRAKDYLKGRGLDGKTAALFKLGFAPPGWDSLLKALGNSSDAVRELETVGLLVSKGGGGANESLHGKHYDRFRDRIVFPITDHRGRVIGFGGRVMGDDEPKYLNSPETPLFHKGRELYGFFHARKANRALKRLIVVEGYMDVIALHQFGVTNAVATLGTATTPDHLERLFKAAPEVVFCFDGDAAGRKAAWRALETALPVLTEGRYVSFLFLPAEHDPDSLVRAQNTNGLGAAVFADVAHFTTLSDFLFNTLCEELNLTSEDGRARLVDVAKPHLQKVPAGALKQLLAKRLADSAQMDFNYIAEQVGARKSGERATPASGSRFPAPRGRQAPSLVRAAITLLLHQPSLARRAESPDFLATLTQPGAALLKDLLARAIEQPEISPAALLEYFRERDDFAHLQKLLNQELTVPEDGMAAEFNGTLDKLRTQALRAERARTAPVKKRPSELTAEEKTALRWRKR